MLLRSSQEEAQPRSSEEEEEQEEEEEEDSPSADKGNASTGAGRTDSRPGSGPINSSSESEEKSGFQF